MRTSCLLLLLPILSGAAYPLLRSVQDCSNGQSLGHITSITMTPSAPVSGDWIQLDVEYSLDKPITGGTASYAASFNGFPLTPTTDDLCTDLANTTTPCPIDAGFVHYIGVLQVGDGSVHGTIAATTTWKDQDGYQILCFGFAVRV